MPDCPFELVEEFVVDVVVGEVLGRVVLWAVATLTANAKNDVMSVLFMRNVSLIFVMA